MAQMTYEEYSEKRGGQMSSPSSSNSFKVNYFSLKDDGDTAIVRFNVKSSDDIIVHSQHTLKVDGKWRKIECLRNSNDSVDICPLCKSGERQQFKIYLELLVYENENGKVVKTSRIWETSVSFRRTLNSYIMDYGDLRKVIFKLTRQGKKGDMKTTYTLIPANPQIYTDENYVPDFSDFDTFDIHRGVLLNKSKEELEYLVANGNFPSKPSNTLVGDKNVSGEYSKATTLQDNKEIYGAPDMLRPESSSHSVRDTLRDNSQPIRTVVRGNNDFRDSSQETNSQQAEQKSPRRYTY